MIPLASICAALSKLARAIPWQVWAIAGLLAAIGLYGCDQRRRGRDEATSTITKSNEQAKEKADAASKRVEDCVGVWDRSRGVCVPDGAGR